MLLMRLAHRGLSTQGTIITNPTFRVQGFEFILYSYFSGMALYVQELFPSLGGYSTIRHR